MFYPNSTCRLMNMVFSAGELLPSHVLSTSCCWKWMYVFLLFSNLLPKFHLSSHEHGIFSKWVVAFPCIKYMLLLKVKLFLLFSNVLPKFHLSFHERGILSEWVVAFPCIKYMLMLKVNVFLLFPIFYPNSTCCLMNTVFSGSELLPSHVLSTYMLLLKVNVFLLFPIFYPNSTCRLMNTVFSGSELLPSHVLSTCCCWK